MEVPTGKHMERRCPRCGNMLDKNDTICSKCGKRVRVDGIDRPKFFVRHLDN